MDKEEFFQTFRKEVVEEYCKKAIESYKYLYGKVTSFYNESKALKENVEMAISLWGCILE